MQRADFLAIRPWLVATDIGMLTYWALTAANALGLLALPPAWLFSDYTNPDIVAWNWSFLPLDVVFSVSGLGAAWLFARDHAGWRPLLAVSLVLTWCAGFMAVSFWAVRGDFDQLWWGVNLFLVAWPMAFSVRLWRRAVGAT